MDKTLEILIKFGLKDDAAKQAAAELQKLTDQTKEAGQETQKATEHTGKWKQALGLLGREFGPIGALARLALNPFTAGVALIVVMIRSVKSAILDWKAAMDELDSSVSTGLGNMRQSMLELQREAAASHKSFDALRDKIVSGADDAIRAIEGERDALLMLQDAAEKFEMSQATTESQSQRIRERYADNTIRTKEDAAAKILGVRQAEIDAVLKLMTGKQTELTGTVGGRTPEQVALLLKDLPKQIEKLTADLQLWRKGAADDAPNIFGMLLRGVFAGGSPQAEMEAHRGRLATITTGEEALRDLEALLTNLIKGQAINTELEDLRTRVEQLNRDKEAQKAQFARQFSTERAAAVYSAAEGAGKEGRGDEARLIMTAAVGMDAINAGGRASAEQSRAINMLAELLGFNHQNQKLILDYIARLNDDVKEFQQGLSQVVARTQNPR
jgi:hypothetical protein